MTDQVTHPLLAYPEVERVAYLSIIAELSNVDSKFDEQERKHLDEQLKAFEISDEGKAKVYAAVFHFKEEHRSEVLASLHALDDSDLRFTLIADLFLLALSNGYISAEELEYVEVIGSELGITKDQVMAIRMFSSTCGSSGQRHPIQMPLRPCSRNVPAILRRQVFRLPRSLVPEACLASALPVSHLVWLPWGA